MASGFHPELARQPPAVPLPQAPNGRKVIVIIKKFQLGFRAPIFVNVLFDEWCLHVYISILAIHWNGRSVDAEFCSCDIRSTNLQHANLRKY